MKKTKLTDQEVDTLRWMFTVAGSSKERLSADYGLTASEVSKILRGKKRASEVRP